MFHGIIGQYIYIYITNKDKLVVGTYPTVMDDHTAHVDDWSVCNFSVEKIFFLRCVCCVFATEIQKHFCSIIVEKVCMRFEFSF